MANLGNYPIIWERSSKKSRAQKMSGGAAGGLPAEALAKAGGAAPERIAMKRDRAKARASEELTQYVIDF